MSNAGRADSEQGWPLEARDAVARLEKALERQVRINDVLIRAAEQGMDSRGAGAFALFQAATLLEERVKRRTEELAKANDALQREVFEHRRAEERLEEAHAQTRMILASMPVLVIGLDGDDRIIEWNPEAERILLLRRGDVIGKPLSGAGLRWEWPRIHEGLQACRECAETQALNDLRFTRDDRSDGFLQISISPVVRSSGGSGPILVAGEDVTERRRLEHQIVQTQRLLSVAQLAAGVAHEINTPLQYVGDNIRFLGQAFVALLDSIAEQEASLERLRGGTLPPDGAPRDGRLASDRRYVETLAAEIPLAIKQTLDGVDRVSAIVRSMKEFSHPGASGRVLADLNRAIQSTVTLAGSDWRDEADLVTDLATDLPPVPVFIGELKQVILGLVVNAAHAIREKKKLGRGAADGKGTIAVSTRHHGRFAEVRVSDSGIGIPLSYRDRIFDPFFTTKEVGQGTGQGLAIAHRVIVEDHGGTIELESEVDRGTTFIIRLPLGEEAAAEPKQQDRTLDKVAPHGDPAHGSETLRVAGSATSVREPQDGVPGVGRCWGATDEPPPPKPRFSDRRDAGVTRTDRAARPPA